jgi:hypothetical protein
MILKRLAKKVLFVFKLFGLDIGKFFITIRGLPFYFKDLIYFKRKNRKVLHKIHIESLKPYLSERFENSGSNSGHYFYQDLYVAQKIFERNPDRHVDIGSRIDGFVAHVASFREIEVFDIRPMDSKIKNIFFKQADFMSEIKNYIDYTISLSCLHAIEHFGLGRYGDPINPNGYLNGVTNLKKLLGPGGILYLSFPFGKERIEFNAHRVFSLSTILNLFEEEFSVECFSFVDDIGRFHENTQLTKDKLNCNYDCNFGCAILEMKKNE